MLILCLGIAALVWKTKQMKAEKLKTEEQAAELAAAKSEQQDLPNGPPKNLINDSTDATIKYAAARGWVPCSGSCLKLATPGWIKRDMDGFAPSDRWYPFPISGSTRYFSQRHVGHIIKRYSTKLAEDVGPCPICGGVAWLKQAPSASSSKKASKKVKTEKKRKK